MDNTTIVIRGAREHNLRNVDLDLPRNQLIVFTGVCGSGKSSLAFDTLYAEGQRRYVESLSSYARQFLGQMQKPDVDYLGGLSPSISIQQKTAGRNPRSTVGTITEIHDYLRVLYARVGQGHCPECGRPITAQTREQIIARILALPAGTRFLVLAPVVRGQKGEYKDLFADMLQRGFVRARVDGQVVRLTDDLKLDRKIKHDIEIVIDRLKNDAAVRTRLAEAVEQALALGEGSLIVAVEAPEASARRAERPDPRDRRHGQRDILFSAHYACTHCNKSYEPPTPQLFSFNSPHGMCPDCDGLGTRYTFDPDLLIPDPTLSFYQGPFPLSARCAAWAGGGSTSTRAWPRRSASTSRRRGTSCRSSTATGCCTAAATGTSPTSGSSGAAACGSTAASGRASSPTCTASSKKAAGPRRMQLEKVHARDRCPACHGQRLNPQARAVRVGGKTLVEASPCRSRLGANG